METEESLLAGQRFRHRLAGERDCVGIVAGGTEPLSQSELSARLGLDPTIVLGVIDALEERAAIRRTRDPADRQRSLLEITASGRKLHAKASAAVAIAERDFLGPLGATDRKELRRLLLEVMQHRIAWLARTDGS